MNQKKSSKPGMVTIPYEMAFEDMITQLNHIPAKKAAPPLFKLKDLIDYLGIWLVFTIFLSSLPLLFKVMAYIILSKTFILTESITEILFLAILLSSDSIRVVQISRKKQAINSILLFLNIPSVILSMIFYGFFAYVQYANNQIVVPYQEQLLLALVFSALIFDISAQAVYIVQGNLSYPIDSDIEDLEPDVRSDKTEASAEVSTTEPEVSTTELEVSTTKPEVSATEPEVPAAESEEPTN